MQVCRLTANSIACRRGDRVLFADVSFVVDAGEALHLAAPNGVGKSSLIRILAGLLRPFAGSVTREGAVALADEHLPLDAHLPLGAAMAFWARFDALDHAALDAAVQRLGLCHLTDVPVRYLSTGQKKRALLAPMIARAAPVWLLDEPLNGLDSEGVETVRAVVAEHCAGGGLTVIASHLAWPGLRRLDLTEHAQ